VSARREKKAPQGEAPQSPRTDQSFIAGIGLAGTAAATVVLGVVIGLGAASFQIWPDSPQPPSGPVVELEVPTDAASVELQPSGLLASTSPLDLPGVGTGAPAPGGNGNGSNGIGVGADGLVPGETPANPVASVPGAGGGDLGSAGEDVEPGDGGDSETDPPPVVIPPRNPPVGRPNPPAGPGVSGAGGGNGRGHGRGGGRNRGRGAATEVPEAGATDSESATTGPRRGSRPGGGRQGRMDSGRGARYSR
jgi:hypothetical protein